MILDISLLMLSSATPLAGLGQAATRTTASVAREFFSSVYYQPGSNMVAIAVMGIVLIAACLGTAYLVKLAYQKYCPKHT